MKRYYTQDAHNQTGLILFMSIYILKKRAPLITSHVEKCLQNPDVSHVCVCVYNIAHNYNIYVTNMNALDRRF